MIFIYMDVITFLSQAKGLLVLDWTRNAKRARNTAG